MSETKATDPGAMPPQAQLFQLITGKFATQAVHVIAKLGIADLLAVKPLTAADLAKATHSNADALRRVLLAAAALGVLREEGGRFSLTEAGTLLRGDVPGSLRDMAVFLGADFHTQAWADFPHAVATGAPAFDHAHGMNAFEYFAKMPEAGNVFHRAMTSFTSGVAHAVSRAYDFSTARKIVDVGGGHGLLLCTLLEKNPKASGVLYDMPEVTAGASDTIAKAGLADRVEIASGSFFESVPQGGDVYVMKHIIHDWDDARAGKILSLCRAALPPGGRVLLIELVLPASTSHPLAVQGHLMDIEMLAMTPGGRERTEEDYKALFATAGLALKRIVPTESPVSVIEAVAV